MAQGLSLSEREATIQDRLRHAVEMLTDSVEIAPEMRGGVPVLKGTRIPIARIVAELSDDLTVSEIADDFEIDVAVIKKLLEGIALYWESPMNK